MMKKLTNILIILGIILVLPITASAGTIVDLIAGQHYNVGTVTVTDDGIVTYQTIPGCVLTETHLHVAPSEDEIPQTRKGNPIPGRFDYNDHHNPPVTLFSYATGGWCDEAVIAAHAVVSCIASSSTSTMTVVSDTSVCVRDGSESCPASCSPNAVVAWQPVDPTNTLWDDLTGNFFKAAGADWIWESNRVNNPISGDIVEFEKCFNIPGIPLSGTLDITCDNGYEAELNNQGVGSAQLVGDWRTSLLTEPCLDPSTPGVTRQGWQTKETFDVYTKLQEGPNSLHVTGVNEAMMDTAAQATAGLGSCNDYYDYNGSPWEPDDFADYPNFSGDVDANPAGCAFVLDITYATDTETLEETAWAAGDRFNPRRSWATYFTSEISCD
jgi:hypothetical protein